MADEAHEHITVGAAPARCYEVASSFERYPEWARDVKDVTVLQRDDEGRAAQVEFRVAGLRFARRAAAPQMPRCVFIGFDQFAEADN